MTDNSDLLGGDAPTPVADKLAAPKKRVRRTNAQIAADKAKTPAVEILSQTGVTVETAELVPDSTNPEQRDAAEKPAEGTLEAFLAGIDPEVAKRLAPDADEDTSKFDELQSVTEADGSVSVQLPEVSADYTLAMAHRVRVFGEQKRTYAYQRVLRAGKKL